LFRSPLLSFLRGTALISRCGTFGVIDSTFLGSAKTEELFVGAL
jgi:hypothetical protein